MGAARRTGTKKAPRARAPVTRIEDDRDERVDAVRSERPRAVYADIMLNHKQACMVRSLLYGGLFGMTEGEVVERLVAESLARHFPGSVR